MYSKRTTKRKPDSRKVLLETSELTVYLKEWKFTAKRNYHLTLTSL